MSLDQANWIAAGKFPYQLGWGFRSVCGRILYWDSTSAGRQGDLGYWSEHCMSQDVHNLPNFTFIVCFCKSVVHKWVQVPSIWK